MAGGKDKLLCVQFNEDHSCFVCGTEGGFRGYNVEPLKELFRCDLADSGGFAQVHMLWRTNFVAVVGTGRHMKYPKNKVFIWDAKLKKMVLEFTFGSPVHNVIMKKDMIFFILRKSLFCYDFPTAPNQLFTLETRDNPRGLGVLSSSHDNQFLAFPGRKHGSVQLMDLASTQPGSSSSPLTINAHQGELACLALNHQGTQVATASDKGTLIRVFDIRSKTQIIELRRGADPAALYCITFSPDSSFLCASSDKGTVHIFAIKDSKLNRRSTLAKVGLFGQYIDSQWGLASFSVAAECPCVCAFGHASSVIAACLDGAFHRYVFSKEGNCNRESFDVFLELGDDENF